MDELPQPFNVLAGHMSLVGPRPLPAEDLEPDGQSREFRTWARERSDVLPGITGLWQVSGRSSLPFEDMVELDLDYIRRWSFALDLRVLLETPRAVLSGPRRLLNVNKAARCSNVAHAFSVPCRHPGGMSWHHTGLQPRAPTQ